MVGLSSAFHLLSVGCVNDNEGKDFIVVFMQNAQSTTGLNLQINPTYVKSTKITASITSPGKLVPSSTTPFINTNVDLQGGACPLLASLAFNLLYIIVLININTDLIYCTGIAASVAIPNDMMLSASQKSGVGIRVQTTQDVGVFGLSRVPNSCDGFMALPTATLGMEYYTVSFYPTSVKTEVVIVATEASTTVTVRLPDSTGVNDVLIPNDNVMKKGGQTFNVALNAYEALQFQSQGDLTGTKITADKKIAVLSGNVDTAVRMGQAQQEDTSHLMEQMVEVKSWGRLFFLVKFPGRSIKDSVKIITQEASTKVRIDGGGTGGSEFTILRDGDFVTWDVLPGKMLWIEADKDILVAQFALSRQVTDVNNDPAMMLVPPSGQWKPVYTFSTGRSAHAGQTHYMMLVIEDSRKTRLVYNEQPLATQVWTTFLNTPKQYVGSSVVIAPGKKNE